MAAENFAGGNATGLSVYSQYKYLNITTGTSTLVKTGVGMLASVMINKGVAAATITIYDGIDNTGAKIGTITMVDAVPHALAYQVSFTTGLYIVTSGASDITVTFR